MPIYRRSRGCGCSVCDGKRIVPGVNDLATLAPNLAKEWDEGKNNGVKPTKIALHSNDRYHWRCSHCGHSWKASPNNRAYGKGCPKCAGHVIDPDINSFAAINPLLLDQWDDEKNKPLTAWDVAAYDNRDYYWICKNGHSFPASPANRTKGTRCPYCTGKLPVVGVNDFATVCPAAAAEWHPSENGDKLPEQHLPNSHENIVWLCKEGHIFQKKIYERTYSCKCPYCEERLPVVGETDLGTLHPELVKRWNTEKNERSPELYFPDSTARVYWLCEEEHSFRAPIREMVLRWRCRKCEKKRTASHRQ